ncbi:NUDIX domain-containing protein [Streptomyces gilvosporeus]|uniref:DNA mismatch repair protein MutT n=1 Tax=Streptomyces gilvosporeus TaxID=553510 RepID=A0A1V0TMN2_9ACTN|nr:NUDIX domain-containing protein [Streptomyces gilvosporeus]ARF54194.1 DNA mismatch repair protein MutT [Streptomyces gilvosporeus]
MTAKRSAGLLLYRSGPRGLEVLLAHMGGPLWARWDAGAWSVPKGEYAPPEEARDAARREFGEELGLEPPGGPWLPLGDVRQAGGKVVTVWAVEGDLDPRRVVPGTFAMEWPRGSGKIRRFPEIDRVAWWTPQEAAERLVKGQRAFLERLAERLGTSAG